MKNGKGWVSPVRHAFVSERSVLGFAWVGGALLFVALTGLVVWLLPFSVGTQMAVLSYPDLSSAEIFAAVDEFYRAFYFRPSKIAEMVLEMLIRWTMFRRRIREGIEFLQFLKHRAVAA